MRWCRPRLTRGEWERGASAVEYALIVTLISVAIIGGATLFGAAVGQMFDVNL